MNYMQNVDIDREGAKAAAGFKTAAIVVVIGIVAAAGEAWQPIGDALPPPVDGMRAEFVVAPRTELGTPYTPSPEAYQAMERVEHVEAF